MSRHTVRRINTAYDTTHTASKNIDRSRKPPSSIPTEMMPLAITKAKYPGVKPRTAVLIRPDTGPAYRVSTGERRRNRISAAGVVLAVVAERRCPHEHVDDFGRAAGAGDMT